ncbi:MAG: hypothetical protein CUN54_08330 [Phototrophicales bacterium]|nr:MAG: hypothetical protein CUN54_08330 [Phototrophicales bacterium]
MFEPKTPLQMILDSQALSPEAGAAIWMLVAERDALRQRCESLQQRVDYYDSLGYEAPIGMLLTPAGMQITACEPPEYSPADRILDGLLDIDTTLNGIREQAQEMHAHAVLEYVTIVETLLDQIAEKVVQP